jgi:hypothetical protein
MQPFPVAQEGKNLGDAKHPARKGFKHLHHSYSYLLSCKTFVNTRVETFRRWALERYECSAPYC